MSRIVGWSSKAWATGGGDVRKQPGLLGRQDHSHEPPNSAMEQWESRKFKIEAEETRFHLYLQHS